MKYVKSLLPYEIFMANIEAGNDRELIIRDLVESYDLTITSSSRPGGICAVSTLINIYEKYGFHTLDRVLRLCVATWEGAPMSFSSNMLNAIARLDNAYGETMKDDTFKEKVGRVSVREISRTARERRAGSLGFAEALLLEYNKKSKYSLPFEKLYTHKTPKKREPSTEDESRSKFHSRRSVRFIFYGSREYSGSAKRIAQSLQPLILSILSKEHPALRLSFMQSLFYLIPNSSTAPSATLYMNTHSKYLLLPDTLSCKQIQCDI